MMQPGNTSSAEEEKERKLIEKHRRLSMFLPLLMILAATVYYLVSGNQAAGTRLRLRTDSLTLTDSTGVAENVSYSAILSVELLESPDFGEPAGGRTVKGVREGEWSSDTLGRYIASAAENIPCAVLMKTPEKSYLFNYESAEVTRELARAVSEAAGGAARQTEK